MEANERKSNITMYISICAIVVSLFLIGVKMTGYATVNDQAVVNVTIISSAAINFTTDFIDFGAGIVNPGELGATLNTENSVTLGNWTPISSGLVLQNIGNVNVSLNFSTDKTPAQFLAGTNPLFQLKVTNTSTDVGACTGTAGMLADYVNVSTTEVESCSLFEFNDTKDSIDVDVQIYIPSDSNTGEQTITVIAEGYYV